MKQLLISRAIGRMTICLFISGLTATGRAQEIGATPTGTDVKPVPGTSHDYTHLLSETVNPATGSVSLRIQLPTPKGRGISFPFSIAYDSGSTVHLEDGYPGLGWSNATGIFGDGGWAYVLPTLTSSTRSENFQNGYVEAQCDFEENYTFTDFSNAGHGLGIQFTRITGANPSTANCPDNHGSNFQGGDGVVSAVMPNPAAQQQVNVTDLDGTIYSFSQSLSPYVGNFVEIPDTIEDRNGNIIRSSTSSTGSTNLSVGFTDTASRTIVSIASSLPSTETSFADSISAGGLGYSVLWKSATFNYSISGFQTNTQLTGQQYACPTILPPQSGHYRVISSISLPNNHAYTFYYGTDNPDTSLNNPYGLISEIIYPNGGWVKYKWKVSDTLSQTATVSGRNTTLGRVDNGVCTFNYKSVVLASRQVSFDGATVVKSETYTYSTDIPMSTPGWSSKNTTVASFDGVLGKSYLKTYSYLPIVPFPPFSTFCISCQIPLESLVNTYDWTTGDPTADPPKLLQSVSKQWENYYDVSEVDTTVAGQGIQKTTYLYAAPGHVSEQDDYDFGASSPTRKTLTSYVRFYTPCKVQVEDGNGKILSETDMYYDGSTSLCSGSTGQSTAAVTNLDPNTHDETNYGPASTVLRGNLTKRVRVNSTGTSPTITYGYDETGQMISMTDACGNSTCSDMSGSNHTAAFSYTDQPAGINQSGNSNVYLTSSTDVLSHSTSYLYNYVYGQLSSTTDPNGNTTNYLYDDSLQRLTETDYPDNGITRISYNDNVPSLSTTVVGGTDPNVTTEMTLDGMGHTITTAVTTDPSGAYTTVVYDGEGQLYKATVPYGSGQTSTTQYTLDPLGRKQIQLNPDGSSKQWCYSGSASGQSNCAPKSQAGASSDTWTDYQDENGNRWQNTSDGLGRLTGVSEPNGAITNYTYNLLNDLIAVSQQGLSSEASRIRNFTYDPLSRLLTASNPEAGTICYGTLYEESHPNNTASSPQYKPTPGSCGGGYDANGNLSAKTDANGSTITYQYDALNRATLENAPYPYNYSYYYDDGPNGIGRLTSTWQPIGTGSTLAYDSMGRVTSTSSYQYYRGWVNGMGVKYSLSGNPTDLTYPDGRVVTQRWDGAGRLSSSSSGGVEYVSNMLYTPAGAPQSSLLGNGTSTEVTYNMRLQPCRSTATAPALPANAFGGNLFDRQLFYNPAASSPCGNEGSNNGNVYAIVDNVQPGNTQAFSYDSLNRLHTATQSDGSYNHQYNYDSFGNMLLQDNLHASPNYSIDAATNRLLLNISDFQYNPSGTLASSPGHSYLYDPRGNLRCIDGCPTGSYLYNAHGERTLADQPGMGTHHEYVYFDGQTMAESDQTGAWTDYIYANGKKIAKIDPTGGGLHLSGNTVAGSGSVATGIEMPGSWTIQPGDTVYMKQWTSSENGIAGGIWFGFTNGDYSTSGAEGWITDQKGQSANLDYGPRDQWNTRVILLNPFAGLTVNRVLLLNERIGSTGQFDLYFADVAVHRADGTVIPIWTAQSHSGFQPAIFGPGSATSTAVAYEVPSCCQSSGTADHYYVSDHLGTTQLELSSGGWPVWQGSFSPYGQEIINGVTSNVIGQQVTDGTAMRYKFTGKERDTESGLDYFGARYYGSNMGRFLSPDPMNAGSDDSDPQSWNGYSYVGNNPLGGVDPTGEDFNLIGGKQCGQNGIQCDQQGYVQDSFGGRAVVTDAQVANGGVGSTSGARGIDMITTGQGTFQAQFFDASPNVVSATIDGTNRISPSSIDFIQQVNAQNQASMPLLNTMALNAAAGMSVPFAMGAFELADSALTPNTTLHGAVRMGDNSRLGRMAARMTRMLRTEVRMQGDGATVSIRQVAGRYNVVVENESGEVVTTFKNLSQRSLERLARNYGWH